MSPGSDDGAQPPCPRSPSPPRYAALGGDSYLSRSRDGEAERFAAPADPAGDGLPPGPSGTAAATGQPPTALAPVSPIAGPSGTAAATGQPPTALAPVSPIAGPSGTAAATGQPPTALAPVSPIAVSSAVPPRGRGPRQPFGFGRDGGGGGFGFGRSRRFGPGTLPADWTGARDRSDPAGSRDLALPRRTGGARDVPE
ncbi:hypothetical protein FJT64_011128 [Amphibalanus amphitrite]|uniref:Uncharacterized protein n=1 Tax=Amphibalanus amphitrite TaxID=1232801 RepID=A0A6A4VHC1_AMPAM|nr:hypothetical protein FJT64_011128 [Amphibalanus amphitrite]